MARRPLAAQQDLRRTARFYVVCRRGAVQSERYAALIAFTPCVGVRHSRNYASLDDMEQSQRDDYGSEKKRNAARRGI